MKKFLSFICILFLFISCDNEEAEPADGEYILFGTFAGYCVGEHCIDIFKLTDEALYEDANDNYPSNYEAYEGNFSKLDDSKFELVKTLRESIPSQLLSETDTIIGMPDATDGGGVYFAVKTDQGVRFWLIDQIDEYVPEYLKSFKNEINQKVDLIRD